MASKWGAITLNVTEPKQAGATAEGNGRHGDVHFGVCAVFGIRSFGPIPFAQPPLCPDSVVISERLPPPSNACRSSLLMLFLLPLRLLLVCPLGRAFGSALNIYIHMTRHSVYSTCSPMHIIPTAGRTEKGPLLGHHHQAE